MEYLPNALVYGITESEFWGMNPKRLKPYKEAYRLELKEKDENAWMQGIYFQQALLATIGNMFRGKNAKAFTYPDKPFSSNGVETKSTKAISEEERKQQVYNLFLSLKVMQSNFNREHRNEGQ